MDVISEYYDSLSKVTILTKEQEKVEYAKYKRGDSRAGQRLIESCLRLSFSIAKSYWKDNNPETLKDLISSGNEGLIKALSKFDPTKNVKFSTYSAYWILMYIRKYVVEDNKLVKPPISVRRKARLRDSLKRDDNIIYKEAQEYNTICTAPTPEEAAVDADFSAQRSFLVESLLRFLSNRERRVLSASFGLVDKPKPLSAIGAQMNLSSERVRQIKEKAISKLGRWSPYFS